MLALVAEHPSSHIGDERLSAFCAASCRHNHAFGVLHAKLNASSTT
jgi:hypothetical protein